MGASSRLSIWEGLVPGPCEVQLDFWLGVAAQAMVVAMHKHHHCPAGSIYVAKKPTTKVVVANAVKFVFTPYPARLSKVGKEVSHVHLGIGTNPPVALNVDRPLDPLSLTPSSSGGCVARRR